MLYSKEIRWLYARTQKLGAKYFSIGSSALNKKIVCCHVGEFYGPQILIHASIHAREHITTLLVFKQIEYYLKHPPKEGGIYFVPILNPDGVDLTLNGLKNIRCKFVRDFLVKLNKQKTDFKLWKANCMGVDLNTNFDANFGEGRQNKFKPGAENFVGFFPHSEKEVKSILKLTNKVKPALTISYHCKGEVIYYRFNQTGKELEKHREIARLASRHTGYPLAFPFRSSGGYKDYAVSKLHIPSLTVEVGDDELLHPLTFKHLPKIVHQNLKLPEALLNKLIIDSAGD